MTTENIKLARQIFLEIYNFPKVVSKLKEHGFSEEEATALATQASEEITAYELAIDTIQSDLYYGIAMIAVGMIATYLVVVSNNIDPTFTPFLKIVGFVTFGGLAFLSKWLTKRKTIRKFES